MTYEEYKNESYKDFLPKLMQVIEFDNLIIADRRRHITHKRCYLMWFMRSKMKMNYQDIGSIFKRHHATVIHAVKYHKNSMLINDLEYKNNIELVRNFLGQTK